jgi:hypothetical protein
MVIVFFLKSWIFRAREMRERTRVTKHQVCRGRVFAGSGAPLAAPMPSDRFV